MPLLIIAIASEPTLFAAEPQDPKTLDLPAEKTPAAKALIAKLDDDDPLVRDKITRQLKEMGRDALPALLDTQNGKLPDRVLARVLEVLPAAKRTDFEARAKVFLADKDRQFDHQFPGWDQLKAAVKDTKGSRALMADILQDEDCRAMILLAFDPSEDARKAFEGRWEVKKKEWWAAFRAGRQPDSHRPAVDAPVHWLAAALLADLLYGRDYRSYYRGPVFEGYAKSVEGGRVASEPGKHDETVRRLVKDWIERQSERFGLEDGERLAKAIGFDPAFLRICMEKQFEVFAKTGEGDGLTPLAATKDPKYIHSFRRLFAVDTSFTGGQFASAVGEIQVRDAALAMCISLSGQDPIDYGFSAQKPKTTTADNARYWTHNYHFKGEDGKTTDDKRTAAFKKWAEWEKANPDAIKAKPTEKK